MGGFAQVAGWGIYGSTKFAVEGLSEAMQAELSPLGIKVTIVEPGSFRTNFLDSSSLHMIGTQIQDYDSTPGRVRQAAAKSNGQQVNDPAKGAAVLEWLREQFSCFTCVPGPLLQSPLVLRFLL